MDVLEQKCVFGIYFTACSSKGFNWQNDTTSFCNGLAPKRQGATTWNDDDLVYWLVYMRHQAKMS